jgi:hypothetical protein
MHMLKISKKDFSDFLNRLKDSYRLYGPAGKEDIVDFAPMENVSDIDLSFQNSRLSPKSLFLPQSERMFEYGLDPAGEDAHILKEASKDYSPRGVKGLFAQGCHRDPAL